VKGIVLSGSFGNRFTEIEGKRILSPPYQIVWKIPEYHLPRILSDIPTHPFWTQWTHIK